MVGDLGWNTPLLDSHLRSEWSLPTPRILNSIVVKLDSNSVHLWFFGHFFSLLHFNSAVYSYEMYKYTLILIIAINQSLRTS